MNWLVSENFWEPVLLASRNFSVSIPPCCQGGITSQCIRCVSRWDFMLASQRIWRRGTSNDPTNILRFECWGRIYMSVEKHRQDDKMVYLWIFIYTLQTLLKFQQKHSKQREGPIEMLEGNIQPHTVTKHQRWECTIGRWGFTNILSTPKWQFSSKPRSCSGRGADFPHP